MAYGKARVNRNIDESRDMTISIMVILLPK